MGLEIKKLALIEMFLQFKYEAAISSTLFEKINSLSELSLFKLIVPVSLLTPLDLNLS
mgnify:CR=1 FL=1